MPPSPNQAAAPWPEAWRAYREQCCGALNLGCSCFLNAAVQALLPVWYNTYGERATPTQPLAKLAAEQMDLPVAPGIRTATHAALNGDMATPAAPARDVMDSMTSSTVQPHTRKEIGLPSDTAAAPTARGAEALRVLRRRPPPSPGLNFLFLLWRSAPEGRLLLNGGAS